MNENNFVIKLRKDLLGSFTQYIIFAKLYANFLNKKLYIDNCFNLDDMSDFENQDKSIAQYSNVSTISKEDHILNRKKIYSALIKDNNNINNEKLLYLGDTFDIQNKIYNIGFDKVINDKTIIKLRLDILEYLNNTNHDFSKLIAIHFRCGEIINMKDRYIHSSQYVHILNYLKKQYPMHKIIIFTGTLPPPEHDNLEIFNDYEIYCNKPNILELWKIFILADIFVMARSSFSYVPAILRYSYQKTYYANFWHPKIECWNTWYPKITNNLNINYKLTNGIFQIIGGKYKNIPLQIQNYWNNNDLSYQIINETLASEFLKNNFNKKYLSAFLPGDSKWKADLLRFCIMSKYSGIYSDVDQIPTEYLFNLPNDIDTITVIGAHSPPSFGLYPLPKGELHIGFIKCTSPEPLFIDYISSITPEIVASGNPYAINIQGLYIFLCNRWNINEIKPFTKYYDKYYNRTWYFILEKKINNNYKIFDSSNNIVIHSQYFEENYFI